MAIYSLYKFPVFTAGLVARQHMLWKALSNEHPSEECEHGLTSIHLGMEEWHCCSRWQRKLSNKLNAKRFALKLGAKVANLYWSGDSADVIPISDFGDSWVLKSSNGWSSRQVMPISNWVNQITGCKENPQTIRRFISTIADHAGSNYGKLFIEELLKSNDPNMPLLDYKMFCFGGTVKVIQVINRQLRYHNWYTREWGPIHDQMNMCRALGPKQKRPEALEEIIEMGDKLSRAYEFPFVRIDVYDTSNGIYFGEFTHTPNVGPSRFLYTPMANKMLGKFWIDSGCNEAMEKWNRHHISGHD